MKQKGAKIGLNRFAPSVLESVEHMHRQNRTILTAYGYPLGVAESSLMQECFATPLPSHTLADKLHLSPVKVTRMISALEEEKIVKRETAGREVIVSLTPKGKEVFLEAYARARETFSAAFDRIPKKEQSKFETLFNKFSIELDLPAPARLKNDPPLMGEIRALTRAFGFLGRSVFDTDFSPLEWHVLSLIQLSHGEADVASIATELGIHHATVTTTVNRMSEKKFIKRNESDTDARKRPLMLSESGLAALSKVNSAGEEIITNAMKDFSEEESSFFANCWKKYSGETSTQLAKDLSGGFFIRKILTPELISARAFVISTRATRKDLENIPESMLSKKNTNLGIFHRDSGKLYGVIEISAETGSPLQTIVVKELDKQEKEIANTVSTILNQISSTEL